jgi:catechol 2,3-dioxygenase-like lactoylglutathione lyase family enzyme
MALHGLRSITIGVPNVGDTADYYAEFGLCPDGDGWLSTSDGGRQLRIVHAPTRRLTDVRVAADDQDDIDRIAASLTRLGVPVSRTAGGIAAVEPVTAMVVGVEIAPRFRPRPAAASTYNAPGRIERANHRAPALLADSRVTPRRLGHAVIGSTDYQTTTQFFVDGLGFKVSDMIKGAGSFLRCSTDHHNMLVTSAPVNFLHHTSWQVDSVDEVGRGAFAMLDGKPERHVWGLGRHYAGSNFFWYLKDPAGNFSEYYSDMDCIVDDQLWTPEDLEGARGLFAWGPPPPPSFVHPDDLAAMMTGAHSTR